MTYKELLIKYPSKTFGSINVERQWEGGSYDEAEQIADEGWEIFLGHSCGEWVIGTVEDAEQFQKDLVEAIKYCKENN